MEHALRVRHKAEVGEMANVLLRGSILQAQGQEWIGRLGETEEVFPAGKRFRPRIASLKLHMARHSLLTCDHQTVVSRSTIAKVGPDCSEKRIRAGIFWYACRRGNLRKVEIARMVGVRDWRRKVRIGLPKESVSKNALVSDTPHKRGSDLARNRERSHPYFRILDGWRNWTNATKTARSSCERQQSRC